MELPSKEVLGQVSLLIAIAGALLELLSRLLKSLSFLDRQWVRYALNATAFASLGFYIGYLHYERRWVLTNHVQGQVYDFDVKQAARKTWCQWMMDAQDISVLKRKGLVIYEQFPWKDFLFEGKGRPKIGFLSAQDRLHPEEPQGRVAVAIYEYELGRFSMASTGKLTLRTSKRTTGVIPRIAVMVNEHYIGSIKLDDQSTEYAISFKSGFLWPSHNYIYLEPSFDEHPSGKSRLLYLDAVDIATY